MGWPPEHALSCHQAPAGREGRIKAQALFDPFLGKDGFDPAQMRSQTARLRSRRPTSQRGTLRWRVAAPAQEGPWQDGRGVSFVSLLAGRSRSRGQRQQQPPGQTDGGHFLRSGPSHSPEARATAGEVTSPTWAGTQTPFRRQQATDAACRGGNPVTPQAPGAPPASRRPSARGKLRLGLCKGPMRPSPRSEGRGGVELWFHPEKRGGDRDAGGARRESGTRKSDSRGLHLGASLHRGSWIREGKPKKELAPRRGA